MNFIKEILTNVISLFFSIGLIGVLAFVFRAYIRRYIDYIFKKKEAQIIFEKSANLEILKTIVPVFVEINELVYRLRNYARSIIDEQTPISHSRDLYTESCNILSDRLYKYRALLSDDVFNNLHKFKRVSQDFLLLLNISDRNDQLRRHEAKFSPEFLMKLQFLFKEIETLYGLITEALHKKLQLKNNVQG